MKPRPRMAQIPMTPRAAAHAFLALALSAIHLGREAETETAPSSPGACDSPNDGAKS